MNDHLRKAGLKNTIPRQKILSILETFGEEHWSAEAVYKKLQQQGEEIGLATVYRVLTQFEEAGLVIRHHFEGDRSVFELDNGIHHDHLVCVHCGKIHEFINDEIEVQQKKVAEKAGFLITDHHLIIYGVCKTCQGKIVPGKVSSFG